MSSWGCPCLFENFFFKFSGVKQHWSSCSFLLYVSHCLSFPCLVRLVPTPPWQACGQTAVSVCTAGGERARALSASYHFILDLLGSYLLVWRKTMAPWLAIFLVYLISSTNIHRFCHRDHLNSHLFQGFKPTAYAHLCCVTASWLALVRTSEISSNKITAKKAPPRV